MKLKQESQLELERCPYCQVAKPRLNRAWNTTTQAHDGSNARNWHVYNCSTCGGLVLTWARNHNNATISKIYPTPKVIDQTVPERARQYLNEAISCIHAPTGAILLAASSIDAMLKEKGYKEGNLYKRIDQAATDHLITEEMAQWAHEIRLDANEQRHADDDAPLPNESDAQRAIEFAEALAQFLFVLPDRVAKGRRNAGSESS